MTQTTRSVHDTLTSASERIAATVQFSGDDLAVAVHRIGAFTDLRDSLDEQAAATDRMATAIDGLGGSIEAAGRNIAKAIAANPTHKYPQS